jgi:hypothetical protein
MIQAGTSRDRVPMMSLNFFLNLSNPSSRTIALKLTQPLTEMSEATARPARKADNLTAIYEPTV